MTDEDPAVIPERDNAGIAIVVMLHEAQDGSPQIISWTDTEAVETVWGGKREIMRSSTRWWGVGVGCWGKGDVRGEGEGALG